MINSISKLFVNSLNPAQLVFNLFVAFIGGLIISGLYRTTAKGPNFSVNYVHSLVMLSMITCVVIMVIGNNLARAFGLVGAMSIIRFRTAVKDILDIVFIFFALAIGMAAGVNLHFVAVGGSILIGLVFLLLSKFDIIYPEKKEILVQFSYQKDGEEEKPYLDVFNKFCKSADLINVKSLGDRNVMEISYYIRLKDKGDAELFIKTLKSIPGINYANLLYDEEKF